MNINNITSNVATNDNKDLLILIVLSVVIMYIFIYFLSSLYKWPIIVLFGTFLGLFLKKKCNNVQNLVTGKCNSAIY
jgi:hypothetical protein